MMQKVDRKSCFYIHVALRRDDSAPSAALFEARSMPIRLRLARLASGADLSRELSRLTGRELERRRERIRKNEAAKRRPPFSVLPLRRRPRAYASTARAVCNAASSKNCSAYFAGESLIFPNPFPCAKSCGQRTAGWQSKSMSEGSTKQRAPISADAGKQFDLGRLASD